MSAVDAFETVNAIEAMRVLKVARPAFGTKVFPEGRCGACENCLYEIRMAEQVKRLDGWAEVLGGPKPCMRAVP